MQEEQDTCRICSAPAEPDQPLFYPCKCSGTIRYIHQDCLTTWLAHSKKKTCDVCKYPYSFTKVYSKDMPSRLPVLLLIRRLAQQAFLAVVFVIRAILVGIIWLAFLPWATIMTWRMYFAMGESTAWWISSYPRPEGSQTQRHVLVPSNNTSTHFSNITTSYNETTAAFVHFLVTHPTIRNLSADILSGQIIASVIVLGFVAVFLLREWISQNARPGVFDDAEAPPEGDAPPPLPAADPPPPAPPLPLAPVLAPPLLLDAPPRLHPPPNVNVENRPEPVEIRRGERRKMRRIDRRPLQQELNGRHLPSSHNTHETRKGKEKEPTHPSPTTALAKRRHSWDGPPSSRSSPVASSSGLSLDAEQAQFTFTVPVPSQDQDHHELNGAGQERLPSPSSPLRRPPLPVFTLPSSPTPSGSGIRTRAHTPLASPGLATYQAPEEFEAGPSNLNGYFHSDSSQPDTSADSDETLIDEVQAEHHHYFREQLQELNRTDISAPVQGGTWQHAPQAPDDTPPFARYHDFTTFDTRPLPPVSDEADSPEMPPLERVPWSDPDDDVEEEEDEEDAMMPFGALVEEEEDLFERARAAPVVEVAPAARREDPLPGRAEQDALDQEEMDAAMEDDMDGALEAIGLRGPIHGVLQNAGLMIFVLDITIAILVWFPFTMGKSLALLALNPRRSVQLVHFPLRAIRFVTDPVVDLVLYLVARTLVPPLVRLGESVATVAFQSLTAFVGERIAAKIVDIGMEMSSRGIQAANATWEYVSPHILSAPDATVEAGPSLLERLASEDSLFFRLAEPYFAPVGHAVRTQSAEAQDMWVQLAVGSGTSSRLFAIMLGYTVDAILLALYLNVLTVGSVKSAGKAVRNAVRQQLLVVKVAGFIIIELVVFPLGCGVMLDICTVWLFPQGSFRSRAAFLMFAPLTSAFYHWVLGTMFMYQFAVLLAGCRSIMRSGAMWFIKDPQDQNFHPIRDILERPTFVQIRKLLLSALMYGMVVLCGVATVSGLLRIFSRTIMPFRWRVREPLSEIPIDLLFLHTALPYTLHYFRPKKFINRLGKRLWRSFAHQFRLTSYMFGERNASEEYTPKNWTWRQIFIQSEIEMDDSEAVHDGAFRRVPNNDNVALVKHEAATIEVDPEGVPTTAEGRQLMQLQDAEAEKMKRSVKEDYIVVYLPPHFRYRVAAFIFSMWVVGSTCLALALAGPILLGRGFFRLFLSRQVHDGYSFLTGFYLLWACWLTAVSIERMDKRRQRRGGDEPRAQFPLYVAKRSLLWIAQILYLLFFLGFVIPTLVALVIELYIILPARMSMNADVEPRIRIVDMWALGMLYVKIALRAHRPQARGRFSRGIEHIRRMGWTHPDPFRATKEVIAPVTAGLLGMVLVPPIALWIARRFVPVHLDANFLFYHVYPSIFTAAGCVHGISALSSLVGSWSQSVRDKEFLVEMRLQNLEQEAEKEKERRDKEREKSASPLGDVDVDVEADQDADED
ncbi:hypothetical protein EIP91_003117 [Steccherinum ochraceum]|uniref:RING-type E3 ubiquitin transferase n=1 Tax=Steccherinum ochraceum TaxID=92696 RepID=A0A4R0S480_9APHY|nr:hypothetical protein EIP91_003117 [Steccherinum ochraceum]